MPQVSTEVLGALATVTSSLPGGGEARRGQEEMALAVASAIANGRHLIVNAGTGTGKSLAYLIPAILSKKRVVVATATKALQDQLAEKDLPALSAALGEEIAFAVLKGRSNYLCLQRLSEVFSAGVQTQLERVDTLESALENDLDDAEALTDTTRRGVVEELRSLAQWANVTNSGDRAELDFEPSSRAWSMLSVGPRECPGMHRCPKGDLCFAESAREAAANADVIIVNMALYGAHLASGGAVLPEHDVVIFDEAHELAEIMTDALGVDIYPSRLRSVGTLLRPLLKEKGDTVDFVSEAEEFRDILVPLCGQLVFTQEEPPEKEGRGRGRSNGAPRHGELAEFVERISVRLDLMRQRASAGPDSGDEGARKVRAVNATGHLANDFVRVVNQSSDEVVWVDGTPRAPLLRLSPIVVGPKLADSLWGDVTAILTSATITSSLVDDVGLTSFAHDAIEVESPFDYRSQALLYVPTHLPDRRSAEFDDALADELCSLIEAAGGRTLALFTSRRASEEMAQRLQSRIDHPIATQWDAPKARLIEEFKEKPSLCLFATMSFWQGVDIPGATLSLVTLDRLPFPRPDDPLMMARRQRYGGAAFSKVDLPRAATMLAQGAGRLIRAKTDHGVVAVCDTRLANATYRNVLLKALPPMKRTTDQSEVVAFLRAIAASGD